MDENQVFYCCKMIFNIGRRVLIFTKRLLISVWVTLSTFIMACCRRDPKEPKGEPVCTGCVKYKDENDRMFKMLNQTLAENERLSKENTAIQKRSEEITSAMANILETKGDLENVNDEFANTKLAKTFEKLYDNKWTELSEWFDENTPDLNELERIKSITGLMKNAYEECQRLADEQLRRFLFLNKEDEIPTSKEEAALFKIRRLSGQQPGTRDSVIKEVMCKVLDPKRTQVFFTEENKDEAMKQLEGFLQIYIDKCWLMTISHPKLLLIFDVIGQPYTGTIKERFKQFSTQDDVEASDMEKDSVFEVVWPCVALEDGTGVYAKGDVITVDIRKET
ncbi:uncharacterized protein LOC123529932 isoform X2 [Mercenaria mercenaria]|uniref:uncharacterized protein LOC123529932 isoform X2 n=1 Tax=Mercenaria mercenaria TaxID=6596 RepID=UPI00234E755A|nr:uncharacterized protein LOC123529932 isoform X2 [Mercenaria mercenaria]